HRTTHSSPTRRSSDLGRDGTVTSRAVPAHRLEPLRGLMPPLRTVCPACNAALRLTQDVPAGKQIKCPKCGTAFLPTPAADAVTRSEEHTSELQSPDHL